MNYTNLINAIFGYGSVVMAAMVLLVFATTQPMDFTALWCAVCFGAATVACIVGFAKK